jgi:hypothetical protein
MVLYRLYSDFRRSSGVREWEDCYTEAMVESTSASKIEELQHLYRMPEADKIKGYLATRPELAGILLGARPQIESHFGRDAVVELRFPRDYDGDYQGELLAMIQSHLDADAALDTFDRLWDGWWGDASGRRESWPLYLGIEYSGEPVP